MNNNLSWEKYFLSLAKVTAMKSKDPSTKVGAVLVNDKNRVIGMGYNGMPLGDDTLPWGREGKKEDTKYPYVIHAEMNAILNAIKDVSGATLYVTMHPCPECTKFVIQAGIKEIVYIDDKYADTEDYQIAKKLINHIGIKVRKADDFNVEVE